MISIMRRFLDTWVARGFFLVMVVAFVIWGIGDVVRLFGTDTWVAKVGGQTIEVPEVQQAFEQQLNDVSRRLPQGTDVTPEMRREVASAAVQALIGQAVVAQEERRLGIVVPDDSAQALAEAMQRLASEPTLAERMGRHALAAAREKFSIDAVADTLEGRYRTATTTTKALHRAQRRRTS